MNFIQWLISTLQCCGKCPEDHHCEFCGASRYHEALRVYLEYFDEKYKKEVKWSEDSI